MNGGTEKMLLACQVACLAIIAALNFGPWLGVSNAANSIMTVLSLLVFTALHGGMALGWTRLAVFVAIAVMVSFTSEALGVATGLIFGDYYYTENLGPKVLGVPPVTQAAYVSMAYSSLIVARVILGERQTPTRWGGVGVAISAAFIMVSWDLVMDPYQSTISGDWIWRDGGPHFGVPLHNYAGWFGTVFVLILLYIVYEGANRLPPPAGAACRLSFWSLPVINYGLIAIGIIVAPVVGGFADSVAAPQNYSGSLAELQYSLALVAVFTMGTPVALALTRLMLTRASRTSKRPRSSVTVN